MRIKLFVDIIDLEIDDSELTTIAIAITCMVCTGLICALIYKVF